MRRHLSSVLATLLLAACAGSRSTAGSPAAAGCYVVLQARQSSGPRLEFLFPGFFELNSAPAPRAAVPGHEVWLPVDDLSRHSGSWSWTAMGDSVTLQAHADGQGWRLVLHPELSRWQGRLSGRAGDTLVGWELSGRRVDCPGGLVPAAT